MLKDNMEKNIIDKNLTDEIKELSKCQSSEIENLKLLNKALIKERDILAEEINFKTNGVQRLNDANRNNQSDIIELKFDSKSVDNFILNLKNNLRVNQNEKDEINQKLD
jgi:hypothetical protein